MSYHSPERPPFSAIMRPFRYNPYHYGGNPIKAKDIKLLSIIECFSALMLAATVFLATLFINPHPVIWYIAVFFSSLFSVLFLAEFLRVRHANNWIIACKKSCSEWEEPSFEDSFTYPKRTNAIFNHKAKRFRMY
tara:strand:+ start:42311 stop:42715 length:405 start_codon:yes stop_codon:yes gene_type:complete